MRRGQRGAVLEQIHRIFHRGTVSAMSEEQLLERFVARKDDTAFEALVVRHGPMVWGVCRRVLVDPHDAEDAFQATFLVLLKKAGALRDPGRLSPWLYGVAYRVAHRARVRASRRLAQERKTAKEEAVEPEAVVEPESWQSAVDEELNRLPEKYRSPVILCHLEGLSYEDAARQLRWTEGMVRGRLARARERLRSRLTDRGLAPLAGLGLPWSPSGTTVTTLPPALVTSTVEVVARAAANQTVLELTTAATAALVHSELKSMLIAKAKTVAMLILAAGTITLVATGYADVRGREANEPPPNKIDAPTVIRSVRVDNILVATGPPAPDAPKPAANGPFHEGVVEIQVVDKETGKPLAGATAQASIDFTQVDHTTDQEGRTRVDLTGRKFKGGFSVDVWAEGYVQQRHDFSNTSSKSPRIPEQLTVKLLPGEETFGGLVKDEQGNPIAGATVELWGYLGEKKDPHELAYMVRSRTDANGRWQNRSLRKMQFTYLYLSHPDYIADDPFHLRAFGSPQDRGRTPSPDLDRLRDQTDVQVMTRGVELRGRVLDDSGQGVAGADVLWVAERSREAFANDVPRTKSGADGRFLLPHVRPGKLMLVAKADGLAPAMATVDAAPGVAPVELQLAKGKTLKGRVEDESGRPIEGAFVNVDSWRHIRALGVYLATDAEGRFHWDSAPADSFLLSVSRQGFLGVMRKPTTAGDEETLFQLKRSLEVAGPIKDGETGKPIASRAEVEIGTVQADSGKWTWVPLEGGAFDGELHASVAVKAPSYRFRIKVVGYEPFETREIRSDEGGVTIDIALKKDARPGLTGIVLGPDGRPVRGADVVVATKEQPTQLKQGQAERRGGLAPTSVPIVTTDDEGRFKLPRIDGPFKLAVGHDAGFARIDSEQLKQSAEVRLLPWGRVEGQLLSAGRPAAGQTIKLSSDDTIGAFWSYADAVDGQGQATRTPVWSVVRLSDGGYQATTDREGRFAFNRVAPLDMELYHVVGNIFAHSALIKVEPGQVTKVTVGGTGRPVIGRIVLPQQAVRRIDYTKVAMPVLRMDQRKLPYPEGLSLQEKSEWLERWWNTPEGKAHRSGIVSRPAQPGPDGRFRAEDVTPGQYILNLSFYDEDGSGRKRQVASLTHRFDVPEIPGGRSDEPLDLGDLELRMTTLLNVGQPAPAFDFVTLDGQTHELNDYRGKYVLIDFWATWCGPCIKEVPFLKAAHDAFAKDDRFVLISLSLDDEIEKAKGFLKDKDQPWIQGYLGPWAKTPVPERYEVGGIPAILLIGPDGKVVAKNLRGEAIKEALTKALSKP